MCLETERLILRPWREDDARELFRYASDPDVGPAAGWPAHTSVENSREIIKNVLSREGTYAIVLKETGLPVGSIGIKRDSLVRDPATEAELGYWIGRPFWGQGLIPEAGRELLRHAFESLNMRAVWCGYYEGNVKSRRVQDKLGFVYQHPSEGLEVELLGEIRNGHVTLLKREEWESGESEEREIVM